MDRLNLRIMLAAAIWGAALQLGLDAFRGPLSKVMLPFLFRSIYATLSVLAMALYPLLVSRMIKQRTSLWMNSILFGMWGGVLGSMSLRIIQSLMERDWITAILIATIIGFILSIAGSKTNAVPALKAEREKHPATWEALNLLSLLSLLFLQVPFLSDNAD